MPLVKWMDFQKIAEIPAQTSLTTSLSPPILMNKFETVCEQARDDGAAGGRGNLVELAGQGNRWVTGFEAILSESTGANLSSLRQRFTFS